MKSWIFKPCPQITRPCLGVASVTLLSGVRAPSSTLWFYFFMICVCVWALLSCFFSLLPPHMFLLICSLSKLLALCASALFVFMFCCICVYCCMLCLIINPQFARLFLHVSDYILCRAPHMHMFYILFLFLSALCCAVGFSTFWASARAHLFLALRFSKNLSGKRFNFRMKTGS